MVGRRCWQRHLGCWWVGWVRHLGYWWLDGWVSSAVCAYWRSHPSCMWVVGVACCLRCWLRHPGGWWVDRGNTLDLGCW